MNVDRYLIELKAGIFDGLTPHSKYEVRFTTDNADYWHISKPVFFDRAVELLKEVRAGLEEKSAFCLPEEFHIVGRMELKQIGRPKILNADCVMDQTKSGDKQNG